MIDWHRVRELQDEVGVEDFAEVVELFLEEADEVIARLETGAAPDTLEAEYHALKGSALNLGFQDLAEICAQAERQAAAGDTAGIKPSAAIERYRASKDLFLAQQSSATAA